MLPAQATALRFFDPMTAPRPDLAAALPRSFMTAAIRASRSPAGPMVAILSLGSPFSSRISCFGDGGVSAPQPAGVLDLDLAVVDQQIDRVLRPAFEEDDVVAGRLERVGEITAAVGVAPVAGEGRLAHGRETAGGVDAGEGEGPGADAEDVLGTQGVDARASSAP